MCCVMPLLSSREKNSPKLLQLRPVATPEGSWGSLGGWTEAALGTDKGLYANLPTDNANV